MNYSNMTTATLQPPTASISLPPISSIDLHTQLAHRSSPEVVQPLPPPPPAAPRVLPPLPYPYAARHAPPPPPPPPITHEYLHSRPLYPGMSAAYHPMPARMPLPSSTDPSLIVAPTRHKTKEVKRRTKTGCLTCRKRRIKVSLCEVVSAFPFAVFSLVCGTGQTHVYARRGLSTSTGRAVFCQLAPRSRSQGRGRVRGNFTRAPLGDGWVAPQHVFPIIFQANAGLRSPKEPSS